VALTVHAQTLQSLVMVPQLVVENTIRRFGASLFIIKHRIQTNIEKEFFGEVLAVFIAFKTIKKVNLNKKSR